MDLLADPFRPSDGTRGLVEQTVRSTPTRKRRWTRSAGSRLLSIVKSTLLPTAGLAIAAGLWELVARVVVHNAVLFPSVEATAEALWNLVTTGALNGALETTGKELVIGYAIAAVGGIALGCWFAASRAATRMFMPLVQACYVTPMIAVAPLIIVLVGVGLQSKVVMVVILSIFPIVVNTEAGLREVDPLYLETARAFRASWWQQFHMVVLRASAPSIVSGLRLGIAGAIAGAVVGEFFGAYSGLGFLVVQYSNAFRTADTMAIVIVLALIGLVANAVLRRVEIALSPWRTTKRAGAE